MTPTVTFCMTNQCNLNCRYCIANCNKNRPEETLDFDAALAWVDRFFPGCPVHVSGGEPLLIGSLADKIRLLISHGHDVTLFTNGTILHSQPDVSTLPIQFQITHHASQGVSFEQFFDNISEVPIDMALITRLRFTAEDFDESHKIAEVYRNAGYEFSWIIQSGGYFGYQISEKSECPNESILMIDYGGDVYNCSSLKYGAVGNTHKMTLDEEKLKSWRCPSGDWPRNCQAGQSAQIFADRQRRTK